jgi:thymidylate synthase ThyX
MNNRYEPVLAKERVVLLEYSKNYLNGNKFATFLIRFPKILLAELNTHRQLVRNCGSSRAIPSATFIDSITNDPYIPPFSQNRPGMTGLALEYDSEEYQEAEELWLQARDYLCATVKDYKELGIHKQDANRLLEPFYHVDIVLSGTDWINFFKLRTAPDAQPAFRAIALKMQQLLDTTCPNPLMPDEWHIPFMDAHPDTDKLSLEDKLKVAIARIARVSYSSHGSDTS